MLKNTIGNWSIYCLKDVSDIKPQDCSLVTAAVAESNPSDWIKVGVTLSSPQDMEMTIRTPRLRYFKRGISVTSDGAQLGRVFIDKCDDTFCQSTIALDSRMLSDLATAKVLTFEYQTHEHESIAIAVDAERFITALGELHKTVFSAVVANVPWTFTVQLRTNPNSKGSSYGWGTLLNDCYGSPATKVVKVSNFEIQDGRSFEQWLSNSRRCSGEVVWITDDTKSATKNFLSEASKYKVYMVVKDNAERCDYRYIWEAIKASG
jgi:invasion protein IalB